MNINGGGTIGLASIKLTVASGERHDGTAGTGVLINRSAGGSAVAIISVQASNLSGIIDVEWLEVTEASASAVDLQKAVIYMFDNTETMSVQRCLVHDFEIFTDKETHGIAIFGDSGANNISNCIVYNIEQTFTGAGGPISCIKFIGGTADALNCTVHNIDQAQPDDCWGFEFTDASTWTIQNCIATDVATTGAGTAQCYEQASPSNATVDHNLATDTTAAGTGSIDSATAADEYVSTTGGSEDLHLKSGADAIDAGTDLVTTPTGVNIDINGRDRDAEGDTWDMGAHELVAAGPFVSDYRFRHRFFG